MKKIGCIGLSLILVSFAFVGLVSCKKDETSDATTFAETTLPATGETLYEIPIEYNGHDILEGAYTMGGSELPLKYSDGFFEVDPHVYQTHMATASMSLSHSSGVEHSRGDYTVCSAETVSIFEQMGFDDVYVSDSYNRKPTADSVGCVIAEKSVESGRGTTNVVAIVLRSGGYEAEWASNFRLGVEGESAGIALAADKVVETYLQDFLGARPDLSAALEAGKIAFWVQGYSRGGGVANLTAKRLVDLYQPSGNDVYAYCIDGQMGGVKDAEIPDRDYTVIHNVVNPNDLVPYLAPAVMGFKRYGLDHYLFSGKADVENPIRDEAGDPVSDNKKLVTMTEKRLALVRGQLVALLGESDKVERYMPAVISYKCFNLFTEEINDFTRKTSTATFLETFINGISVSGDGEILTDRAAYVSSGLEAAFGRLMVFLFSAPDLSERFDTEVLSRLYSDVIEDCRDQVEENSYWGNKGKMTVRVQGSLTLALIEALNRRVTADGSFRELFFDYPDGGFDRALDDIGILLFRMLNPVTDVDDLVSFLLNLTPIVTNHEYLPNLAILRSYDSWFEPTITD